MTVNYILNGNKQLRQIVVNAKATTATISCCYSFKNNAKKLK